MTVKSDPEPGRGQQRRGTVIIHDENENLYGIYGLGWHESDAGIFRNLGGTIAAGFQGDGGAPFFFTGQCGVLVDSDGGSFQTVDDTIRFQRGSRPDAEYFAMVGPPMKTMAGLAALTGRPPMPRNGHSDSSIHNGDRPRRRRKITDTYEEKEFRSAVTSSIMTGKQTVEGGRDMAVSPDANTLQDIPLYIQQAPSWRRNRPNAVMS